MTDITPYIPSPLIILGTGVYSFAVLELIEAAWSVLVHRTVRVPLSLKMVFWLVLISLITAYRATLYTNE